MVFVAAATLDLTEISNFTHDADALNFLIQKTTEIPIGNIERESFTWDKLVKEISDGIPLYPFISTYHSTISAVGVYLNPVTLTYSKKYNVQIVSKDIQDEIISLHYTDGESSAWGMYRESDTSGRLYFSEDCVGNNVVFKYDLLLDHFPQIINYDNASFDINRFMHWTRRNNSITEYVYIEYIENIEP
jgi:hypothetical protein